MVLRCPREEGIYPMRNQISYNLEKQSLTKTLRGQNNRQIWLMLSSEHCDINQQKIILKRELKPHLNVTTRVSSTRNSTVQSLISEKITWNDKIINHPKDSLEKWCLQTLQVTSILPISTFVDFFGFSSFNNGKKSTKKAIT